MYSCVMSVSVETGPKEIRYVQDSYGLMAYRCDALICNTAVSRHAEFDCCVHLEPARDFGFLLGKGCVEQVFDLRHVVRCAVACETTRGDDPVICC